MKKFGTYAVCGGAALTVAGLAAAYLLQERIVYPSNFPSAEYKLPQNNPSSFAHPTERNLPCIDVKLVAADGVLVHGWLLLRGKDRPTVLFFHANAGNRGFRMDFIQEFYVDLRLNVFIIDYRGYGESTDPTTEAGIILDAEAAYNYVAQHPAINPRSLFVFGRSLGGAVATLVAQRFPVTGLILENTFKSIPAVVSDNFGLAGRLVTPLIRNVWPSIDRIPEVRCPVLFISGQADSLIPPTHMAALQAAARKAPFTEFKPVAGADHNDTWGRAGRWYAMWVQDFVDRALTLENASA